MCKPNFLIMRITRFMYKHMRANNMRQILIYLMHVQVDRIYYFLSTYSIKFKNAKSRKLGFISFTARRKTRTKQII